MIAKAWSHKTALAAGLFLAWGVLLVTDAAAQDDAADQPATQEQSGSAASQEKSDLDVSALRIDVDQRPRPTLTSSRGIVLPKILGSYR